MTGRNGRRRAGEGNISSLETSASQCVVAAGGDIYCPAPLDIPFPSWGSDLGFLGLSTGALQLADILSKVRS